MDEDPAKEGKSKQREGTPLSLLAILHSSDEQSWRDLETTMRDEGLDDLCHIRACRVDAQLEWRELLAESEIVLPLLSGQFLAATAANGMAEAVASHGHVTVVPIRLEEIDGSATPFATWQFLPQHGAVAAWGVAEMARQNVARNLIRMLHDRDWPIGLPPLKRLAWDVDTAAMIMWVQWLTVLGGLAAVPIWAAFRHRPAWQPAIAMAMTPLLFAFIALYRELRLRDFGDDLPDRQATEALVLKVFRRFLTVILAAAVFPGLLAVGVAVAPSTPTLALITFVDAGVAGGMLFGVLGYLASRRMRSRVLLKRRPPDRLSTWIAMREGVLTFLSGVPDRKRHATAAIGEVSNRARVAVDAARDILRFSRADLVFVAVEILIATAIAWIVFDVATTKSNTWWPRLSLAGFWMLLLEGLLLETYLQIVIWIRRVRLRVHVSLWRRMRSAFRWALTGPVLVPLYGWLVALAVFEAVAWMFSAPIAPPLFTTLFAAAITAAEKTVPSHARFS